jgi:putative ABC transport system permease protein
MEIRALFLGEAALLGLIGSVAGVFGGAVLARTLVRVVAGTISSLYVRVNATAVHIAALTCVVAVVLGVVSVLAAAWWPARVAAHVDPIAAIPGAVTYKITAPASRRWLWVGAACLALAALLSWLTLATGPRWLGFGAAFFVLMGFSFAVPIIASSFSTSAVRILRRSHLARVAGANLGRALMRNSVTIASLAAAVAMTIGLTVMVFSFRKTVAAWIDQTLLADIFVAPASNEVAGPSSFMPPETMEFLETHPAVAAIDTFREIGLPFRGEQIAIAVVRGSERRRLQFLHGDSRAIFDRFQNEQCVLISEPFARHHHLRDRDRVELPTPAGPRKFEVAGTFYDYTRDRGVVYISSKNFHALWNDDRVNSVAVYLRDGASADQLTKDFREKFSRAGEFAFFSNRSLRARVFEIFDQTFAVTYALRAIAVIVALVGIFFSLSTLILERTRELAVVRAIGGSATQIRTMLLWEVGFIGALAAVVGIASGICLSLVLTGVINRAFFGWTIRLAFPWMSLLLTPTWIIAAAIAAAVVPAWRASRLVPAEALRSE